MCKTMKSYNWVPLKTIEWTFGKQFWKNKKKEIIKCQKKWKKNFISHTYVNILPPLSPFEEALPSGNQFWPSQNAIFIQFTFPFAVENAPPTYLPFFSFFWKPIHFFYMKKEMMMNDRRFWFLQFWWSFHYECVNVIRTTSNSIHRRTGAQVMPRFTVIHCNVVCIFVSYRTEGSPNI